MSISNLLLYFFTGGIVTTIIVALEESGLRLWSGVAALMPIFTLISYLYIGHSQGGKALSEHAWFVLIGTLVSWVPYMITVAIVAPYFSSNKTIAIGLSVFFVLSIAYLTIVSRYHLFNT